MLSMTRELIRFDLDYALTFEYICNNFKAANTLSVELLKLINSEKGRFFTFFNSSVENKDIYQFTRSISSCVINEKETVRFIFSYLNVNPNLGCVFEDILIYPSELKDNEILHKNYAFLYKNEVYYLLSEKSVDENLIQKCLFECNAIWHSLCILTQSDFIVKNDKSISLHEIQSFAVETRLAIIGAYDDEGYIFWERL